MRGRPGPFRALARNRRLLRLCLGYLLFILTEYAVWIAMIVYAYERGGVRVASAVVLVQLVPAAVFAPLAATLADRRPAVLLLFGGYVGQAAGMAGTALAIVLDLPLVAYASAAVAAVAVTTTRPAQAALTPALATTPEELTASNVVLGWLESVGAALAGLLLGGLLVLTGVAGVFWTCAAIALVCPLVVGRLRVPMAAVPAGPGEHTSALADAAAGLVAVARDRGVRVLVGLSTAAAVVIGAIDLLYVILAVDVLHRDQDWAGYLSTAYGVGAMAVGLVTALLVGRPLGRPILVSALAITAALAVLAGFPGLPATVVLIAVIGAGEAVLLMSVRTLLQRTVPVSGTGRVFGVLEGLYMAGLAIGALVVSALEALAGVRGVLVGLALVLPVAAALGGRAIFRLDAGARVPVVEIALLRSLPMFAELPLLAIERLASMLTRRSVPAGTVLLREGESGNSYFAIADGELAVSQNGAPLRSCVRGDGVGEIALLRDIPRTATVIAVRDTVVHELDRQPFLDAVTGHGATRSRALTISDTRFDTEPHP